MSTGHIICAFSQKSVTQAGIFTKFSCLPTSLRLVLFFMMIVFIGNSSLFGFNLSGLAWAIPFCFSLLVLTYKINKVTFPYIIWLPWVLLLFIYLLLVDSSILDPRVSPLQRTIQLFSPLLIGMAASTWRPSVADLGAVMPTMRCFAYMFFIIIGLKTGVLLTGQLPERTGLAAEAISVTLLCTLFVNSYLVTHKTKDLLLWAMLVLIPVISLTRMAIAVSLLTFPLAFGPLRFSRRILALVLIAVVGTAIFYSPRVQKKMFYSGKGTLGDIYSGNTDFATSGRSFMLAHLAAVAGEKMWTGRGTGSAETLVYGITKMTAYPHNDWLLTFFDYGVLGVAVFAGSILLAVGHALKQLKKNPDPITRILLLTGAAGFIPFCLMMFTDNVMVYASFYGNLHFALLGLAYGALRAQSVNTARSKSANVTSLTVGQRKTSESSNAISIKQTTIWV